MASTSGEEDNEYRKKGPLIILTVHSPGDNDESNEFCLIRYGNNN